MSVCECVREREREAPFEIEEAPRREYYLVSTTNGRNLARANGESQMGDGIEERITEEDW